MDVRNYRHELKFLGTEQELFLIENKIRHICRRDVNTGSKESYRVRSLYFDTYGDHCYYENLAGVDRRRKYRIRIYNNSPDVIKLECKHSCHGMKGKEACRISVQQFQSLMNGNQAGQQQVQEELWERFLLERNMEMLVPKVIVEYIRIPYIFPAGNVRITFDRSIRSSSYVASFLKKEIPFRNILPENMHILEVKYDEAIPAAILELLSAGRSLHRTSFSKYALCREYGIR